MLRIIITGAAGRMGRRLVANLAEDPALELAGATEYPGSSLIGADAGELAGAGVLGVKIVPSLEEAFANGGKVDAVIDFSTG
ncbi:MAG: 4-hydroxy-tetrahydrodipicolinate reductase, partial [Lentisphaeria bacterium]|nr:4-hydroxy-tetrahydrodipicolinate reductase [Lentisphaeria bacterium]